MTTNIDVASDLNVGGNLTVNGQLNLYDMILASPTVGFSLYGNDSQGYPTINFFSGNPSTGTLQYSMGVYNDIFYIIPNGGSQAFQVNSSNDVDIPYNLTVGGTSTLTGAVTASEIQVNPTGGNPQGITINGSSTSGSGTQIFFQESGTTYWQLGPNYGSTGGGGGPHDFWLLNNATGTNILQIQSASNAINFYAPINFNTSTKTAGLTAGYYYYLMPFQGASYKKVIVYFVGYENDTTTGQVVPFATAFTTLGSITSNSTNGLSTSNSTLSLSNTELVINPENTTVYNGVIIIEGY